MACLIKNRWRLFWWSIWRYSLYILYLKNHQLMSIYVIAEDIDTHRHYAIKREPLDTPFSQLRHESIMYDVLAGGRKCIVYSFITRQQLICITYSWYSPMSVVWRTRWLCMYCDRSSWIQLITITRDSCLHVHWHGSWPWLPNGNNTIITILVLYSHASKLGYHPGTYPQSRRGVSWRETRQLSISCKLLFTNNNKCCFMCRCLWYQQHSSVKRGWFWSCNMVA